MDSANETAHVLVVDDEGAIRYSVSKTLQRVGYNVSEAASGEDALDSMKKQHYDVILTDIRMPGLTGVELLKRIKDQAPDAIVILMTGYASLGTAVEALRLGAHDYLIKPSSSQDIRASVSRGWTGHGICDDDGHSLMQYVTMSVNSHGRTSMWWHERWKIRISTLNRSPMWTINPLPKA